MYYPHSFSSLVRLAAVLSLSLIFTPTDALHAQAGLTQIDINNPVESTVTTDADGSFTIVAGGGDTWDSTDSFTFLYEEKSGDFDVRVQILNLEVDNAQQQDSAKASLHVRADLQPDSPDVMINGTPETGANYVETIFRPGRGRATDDPPINAFFKRIGDGPYDGTYRPSAGTHLYSPADGQSTWLRMRRVGNTIQVYVSTDGQNWQMLADYTLDPEAFPENLYVGISTVAHISASENQDNRVHATYANYGNTPLPVPTIDGTTPVDPSAGPGVYPTASVTAANWKVVIPEDGKAPDGSFIAVNGANKNELILTLESQGPIPWSAPGYNQGDLDLSISPHDPVAAQSNLGPYSNPSRSLSIIEPTSPVAQAWIPSTRSGLVLATIRKNRQQWNDNGAGGPTPPFSGFASVSIDFSSRKGFSMDNGLFQNGEIYVSFYKLGESEPSLPAGASPFALREANIDLATAWFPFAQGWKAGYINDATLGPAAYWEKQGSHSATVADGTATLDKVSSKVIFKWEDVDGDPNDGLFTAGGLGKLILPGVDPLTDGLLFTISNDDESDNEGQVVGAAPFHDVDTDSKGWIVAMRQDDADYSPLTYSDPKRSEFGFLYIPYSAGKLIGGHIQGNDGTKLRGAGDFTIKRLSAGQYQITIPGKTGSSGMLLLQNCGFLASDPSVVDDAALSYEFGGGNNFVVESHVVEVGGAGDKAITRDTDFYFAWVDFTDPLTPAPTSSIILQSSETVGGPYSSVPGATINTTSKTITTAKAGAARFYRTLSESVLRLKSIAIQGENVVITYE